MDRVVGELDAAFSTVGFVYLKNHGVEKQLVGGSGRRSLEISRSRPDRSIISVEMPISSTMRTRIFKCCNLT